MKTYFASHQDFIWGVGSSNEEALADAKELWDQHYRATDKLGNYPVFAVYPPPKAAAKAPPAKPAKAVKEVTPKGLSVEEKAEKLTKLNIEFKTAKKQSVQEASITTRFAEWEAFAKKHESKSFEQVQKLLAMADKFWFAIYEKVIWGTGTTKKGARDDAKGCWKNQDQGKLPTFELVEATEKAYYQVHKRYGFDSHTDSFRVATVVVEVTRRGEKP